MVRVFVSEESKNAWQNVSTSKQINYTVADAICLVVRINRATMERVNVLFLHRMIVQVRVLITCSIQIIAVVAGTSVRA
jgi:hypothetical protein